MEYIFTLAFIRRENEILMMNREKKPWQGMWNGVGGKRKNNETAFECIKREVAEETGILLQDNQILNKGLVTWNSDDAEHSGMHIYLINLDKNFIYDTPVPTPEGILDWKKIDWLISRDNLGVSYNVPYFIENLLYDSNQYQYQCFFEGNQLKNVKVEKLL